MQGSVRKRGKKWYYYFDLGIVDGKRKRVERVGGTTKKEAEKALREALSEFDDTGTYIDESDMTFSDYLDYWYENYIELNCKDSTKRNYKNRIEYHIKPKLGGNKIRNLTPALLQNFFNAKFKEVKTKSTFKFIATIINSSLEYAVNPLQLIKYNPYKNVRLPKYKLEEKKEVQTITKEQFKQLLEAFPKGDLYHVLLQIGYYTGMRCGEVCALTWNDINLKRKTIAINKTMVLDATSRKYKIDTPKTKSSFRTITIGDTLAKILKEHKIYQREMKLKLGEYYLDKDYPSHGMVCTSKNGNFIRTGTVYSNLGITVKNRLGFDFNFHMLRHTHASMLIQNGANPKDVQKRLGHSNISITLNTYTHTNEDSQRKVADLFDTL